jgi:hypothetical protein
MRLDTECDVSLDAARHPGQGVEAQVAAVRTGLLAEHLGIPPERFEKVYGDSGSLIRAIERLCGPGRSLRPYEIPELSGLETWLADNEVLDPEGPEEMFEPLSKRSLFRQLSTG